MKSLCINGISLISLTVGVILTNQGSFYGLGFVLFAFVVHLFHEYHPLVVKNATKPSNPGYAVYTGVVHSDLPGDISFYENASGNIFCSGSNRFLLAEKIFHSTGCFAADYFSDQTYLNNLAKVCSKAPVHFFFGPCICINRVKLFKLFRENPGRKDGEREVGIFLHYRENFDRYGWDHRHFALLYNGEMTLRVENPHYEGDPDSQKAFFVLPQKEEAYLKECLEKLNPRYFEGSINELKGEILGKRLKYFEDLAMKLEQKVPAKTANEIFCSVLNNFPGGNEKDKLGKEVFQDNTGSKRYIGFAIREEEKTRVATREEAKLLLEEIEIRLR